VEKTGIPTAIQTGGEDRHSNSESVSDRWRRPAFQQRISLRQVEKTGIPTANQSQTGGEDRHSNSESVSDRWRRPAFQQRISLRQVEKTGIPTANQSQTGGEDRHSNSESVSDRWRRPAFQQRFRQVEKTGIPTPNQSQTDRQVRQLGQSEQSDISVFRQALKPRGRLARQTRAHLRCCWAAAAAAGQHLRHHGQVAHQRLQTGPLLGEALELDAPGGALDQVVRVARRVVLARHPHGQGVAVHVGAAVPDDEAADLLAAEQLEGEVAGQVGLIPGCRGQLRGQRRLQGAIRPFTRKPRGFVGASKQPRHKKFSPKRQRRRRRLHIGSRGGRSANGEAVVVHKVPADGRGVHGVPTAAAAGSQSGGTNQDSAAGCHGLVDALLQHDDGVAVGGPEILHRGAGGRRLGGLAAAASVAKGKGVDAAQTDLRLGLAGHEGELLVVRVAVRVGDAAKGVRHQHLRAEGRSVLADADSVLEAAAHLLPSVVAHLDASQGDPQLHGPGPAAALHRLELLVDKLRPLPLVGALHREGADVGGAADQLVAGVQRQDPRTSDAAAPVAALQSGHLADLACEAQLPDSAQVSRCRPWLEQQNGLARGRSTPAVGTGPGETVQSARQLMNLRCFALKDCLESFAVRKNLLQKLELGLDRVVQCRLNPLGTRPGLELDCLSVQTFRFTFAVKCMHSILDSVVDVESVIIDSTFGNGSFAVLSSDKSSVFSPSADASLSSSRPTKVSNTFLCSIEKTLEKKNNKPRSIAHCAFIQQYREGILPQSLQHRLLGIWSKRLIDKRLTTMIGTVAAAATGSAAAASRDLSSSSTGNPQLVLNEIEKSTEDRRSYRCLLLANGLRAVAISDPDADKSAATACVRTGALRDPRSLQGLAHFCEHMLFLGTARYPDENSFLRFINEHGGVRNAVTSAEFTRYYFDIAPEHLPEALDRLGQFFTEPLFTESATVREVNAVHSEHAKNIPIDARRLLRLDHHLANPQHDYSKYSTGCLETLLPDASKAAELRQRLLQFHSENYSANLTAVAVLGRESLDQLQQLIVAAFSGVANKQLPMPSWESHPYDGTDCGVEVQMVPLRDIQKLEVVFPMKDYTEQFSSQPAHYASHLLGHESAGSLLACLKRRGWANGLSAGCGGGAAGFDFFRVSADLTEAGLANRAAVLRAVFQCVGQLRRAGPQAWVHRELSDLAALAFRYRDREPSAEATQRLARRLLTYPMPQLLTADCLVTEFAPELIAEVLDQLHPHRCKVFAVSKAFEPHCPPDGCVEPIYGVRHRLQPLPPDLLAACLALYNGDAPADGADSLLSDLRLPDPNPFIPSQFALIAAPPGSPPPRVVLEEAGLRLWHRADAQYCLPKLCLTVVMATPDAWSDAFSAANSQLHCQLMSDALNPVLYDAQLAGLSASLAACAEGISLSIQGFGHRLPALLEAVLDRLSRPEVEQLRFDSVIERYRKSLKNFALEQPLQQCLFHQSVLCCSLVWTHQQRLDAIEGATPAAAAEFARCQLLPAAAGGRPRFLLAFACGNAEVEQVVAAGGGIAQTLRRHAAAADGSQGRPQPPEQQPHRQRDVLLPEAGDARRHHLLRCLAAEHH
uniref:Peptidase_M16 domain-containing protein n=1 Tax=Macrostomum lignano TaxID=282301 RepID=A0A1I8GS29_9PLAT